MSKAFKIKINKTMVILVVEYGSETSYDRDGYEETEYMGDEGIKDDIWTSGRISNVENNN
jgi:hypothetical protein